MEYTVIRNHGDLKRELWEFHFYTSMDTHLWMDQYLVQTRRTSRCKKWITNDAYLRLLHRESTIAIPPLPNDVVKEAKEHFTFILTNTPVEI